MHKPWYEALYENFEDYDEEPYVQSTKAEVDYIEQRLHGDKALRILDIGCGTGRHVLEFARRGYSVCGLDLSEELLAQGEKQAQREDLEAQFIHGDARNLRFDSEFDVAVILCEGGFSLVETDEMDREILAGAARALRPGGKLLITAPSAVFMLSNLKENPDFDPVSLRESFSLNTKDSQGSEISLACTQRYYTFPEIKYLLRGVGLQQINLFAVTSEGYSDKVNYSSEQFEFGVIAVKS